MNAKALLTKHEMHLLCNFAFSFYVYQIVPKLFKYFNAFVHTSLISIWCRWKAFI